MRRLHVGQRVLARDSANQLRKATVTRTGFGGNVWVLLADGFGSEQWWPARDVHISLAEAKRAQARAALLREVLSD